MKTKKADYYADKASFSADQDFWQVVTPWVWTAAAACLATATAIWTVGIFT